MPLRIGFIFALVFCWSVSPFADQPEPKGPLASGDFKWTTELPVLGPPQGAPEEWIAIKDPSIVRFDDTWHLFCTVRGLKRSHAIVYLSFSDWNEATHAQIHVLSCHDGYYCAPQVFYFEPQKLWYMICQARRDDWDPNYKAAYATTSDISDAHSWTSLQPLEANQANGKSGLDFWVICDETQAYLFFTTLDGRLWRQHTSLSNFPTGWSDAELALQDDIFEAAHIYKLKGMDGFVALIEAQGEQGRRYFKAYMAGHLDGSWKPLAAERDHAFAWPGNVRQTDSHWTDSFSHGELLRAGYNHLLKVDPENLTFLFQGVLDKDRGGLKYGRIPWKLGILEPGNR